MSEVSLQDPRLLTVASLSKHFGGEAALVDADLTLQRGEIRGLIGANGSGKSTFVKLLAGYHDADPGSGPIAVEGEVVDPHAERGIPGFRFVHQNLGLVQEMSVVDNVFIAGPPSAAAALRPRDGKAEERQVKALLDEYGLNFSPHDLIKELRAVDRTMVAVLRALRDPEAVRALVFDEVTATLPPHEISEVLEVVKAFRHCGVIFVSHSMEEVMSLCDTVTVLRAGHVVADMPVAETDERSLVELLAGRPLTEIYPEVALPQTEPVLRGTGLDGGLVRGLDVEVRAGEIVGVVSLDAAEAAGVLTLVYGLEKRHGGEMRIGTEEVPRHYGAPELTAMGVTLVTDRLASGLPSFTVRENLTAVRPQEVSGRWWISARAERKLANELVEEYGVQPPEAEALFESLSGGNQQKAVLARAMRLRPRLLLLDDPTRGVDVGAKSVIYDFVREAAAEGLAVLMASTDFEEIASLCHRVLILKDGALNDVVSGEELSAGRLVEGCYVTKMAA